MAQEYITQLVDDLDGTTADQTITLGLDGVNYVLDLNNGNAAELRTALKPYTDAARKSDTSKPKAPTAKSNKQDLAAIRTWAKNNGHEIADRGRISATITDAYNAAH